MPRLVSVSYTEAFIDYFQRIHPRVTTSTEITRIEWRYLDQGASA